MIAMKLPNFRKQPLFQRFMQSCSNMLEHMWRSLLTSASGCSGSTLSLQMWNMFWRHACRYPTKSLVVHIQKIWMTHRLVGIFHTNWAFSYCVDLFGHILVWCHRGTKKHVGPRNHDLRLLSAHPKLLETVQEMEDAPRSISTSDQSRLVLASCMDFFGSNTISSLWHDEIFKRLYTTTWYQELAPNL